MSFGPTIVLSAARTRQNIALPELAGQRLGMAAEGARGRSRETCNAEEEGERKEQMDSVVLPSVFGAICSGVRMSGPT